jgi:hypothetical protein
MMSIPVGQELSELKIQEVAILVHANCSQMVKSQQHQGLAMVLYLPQNSV